MSIRGGWAILAVLLGVSALAWAEDPQVPTPEASPEISGTPQSSRKNSSKGRAPREKEAEGTEAPNRFTQDPVIKSQYVDERGQHYEVDPE